MFIFPFKNNFILQNSFCKIKKKLLEIIKYLFDVPQLGNFYKNSLPA